MRRSKGIGKVDAAFGVDLLGVNDCGELYVLTASKSLVVSVFGSDAHGNAMPRTFYGPAYADFDKRSDGYTKVLLKPQQAA